MSNIYGHKNFWIRKFDNVIDKFISTGFSNKKILLYADGTQLVDFIHISNFLNILNQIINQKFQKEIYNITSETRQSIHDIALLIKNIAGKKYNISIQINKNDSSKKLPNIPDASASKIKNKIIWQDYQDLSFELEKMCAKIMND
jgi:nucleoside-diphosphate-sugar epimerase